MAKTTDIERKEVIELLEKAIKQEKGVRDAMAGLLGNDEISEILEKVQTTSEKFINQALALLQKPCEWRLNRDLRRWETSCDVHSPINLDPSGTHINYCLNCGQPIKEIE